MSCCLPRLLSKVELGRFELPSGEASASAFYMFRDRLFSGTGRLVPGQQSSLSSLIIYPCADGGGDTRACRLLRLEQGPSKLFRNRWQVSNPSD